MSLLNKIKAKNILVIGDVMLDTYYTGEVKRISPEAPVPVFHKQEQRSVLGGAANVAANLVAAGQNVYMMAVVGKDETADRLKKSFKDKGIDTSLVMSLERNTTEKIRFLADNNQQVLRLDIEDTDVLSDANIRVLLDALKEQISSFDLIVLSDYMKGLLNFGFTQGVLQLARKHHVPAIIDVKDPKIEKYKGAFLLKPNKKELHELTAMPTSNDEEIINASEYLRKSCECEYILTTCGSRGMVLVGDGAPYFIECAKQEVYDVTGAGDTTIAYLAACIVNGFSLREAVDVSNCAAGIQVSKVGTSSVYWNEVREYLINQKQGIAHKLLSWDALDEFRAGNAGKKVVFTNGCFDILHIGHIRYLQEASKLGDTLVIGLNSDASVKRLKGSKRPVNSQSDRAEVLCALEFVDYVIVFDEDTPYELIKKIQPNVLVKGGDYKPGEVVGKDIVEKNGGELVLVPLVEGKSTTRIIEKMTK
ncbi:MAG: D-glycero-beta-D-manno-heptose 1-phosphate adenylyltransferase [Lachnospiraceae bacterium]|nr:D-glycero-beta-D-manno-heptose 1-phosphate adenylyltransferase [Lachnospiraceae bacterium]